MLVSVGTFFINKKKTSRQNINRIESFSVKDYNYKDNDKYIVLKINKIKQVDRNRTEDQVL